MNRRIVGLSLCIVVGIVGLLILFGPSVLMPVHEDLISDFEFRDSLNQTREVLRADANMSDLPCHPFQGGTKCTYNFVINNTGNTDLNLTLKAEVIWSGMTVRVALPDFPDVAIDSTVNFVLNARRNTTISLLISIPSNPFPHGTYKIDVTATASMGVEKYLEIWLDIDA